MPPTSCLRCAEPVGVRDRFCEACGIRVAGYPAEGCVACGARNIGPDRYCLRCGRLQPSQRDRIEVDLGTAAGVSDRGVRRRRNEDALALRQLGYAGDGIDAILAVVCDGVSTTHRPDAASKAACEAGADAMVAALRTHGSAEAATSAAIRVAHQAVVGLADPSAAGHAPACTYVSALITGGSVAVGWIGDSRAYWIPDPRHRQNPAAQLTGDDSWRAQVVASGAMSAAEAAGNRRAHEITGWLGADADPIQPHLVTIELAGPGVLVVCTDGLWNYFQTTEQLAAVIPPDVREAPLRAAKELVRIAVQAGGHDNITVAVLPFVTPSPGGTW